MNNNPITQRVGFTPWSPIIRLKKPKVEGPKTKALNTLKAGAPKPAMNYA